MQRTLRTLIRRCLAALAATLVALPVVLLSAQALAQTCLPPTAEHAFEELLDVAEDDSPLEEEVWRIADEQEATGDFETPETTRRIDELARAHGFVYDCGSRMYHPVAGPDPRDAIENGEEPPDPDDDEPDDEGGSSPPGRGAPRSGGLGATPPAEAGGASSGPGADGTTDNGDLAIPHGTGDRQSPTRTGGTRPEDTAGQPRDTTGPGAARSVDGVPRPGGAPDERSGVMTLTEAQPARPWRTAGIVFLAGTGALLAAAARRNRRRSDAPL